MTYGSPASIDRKKASEPWRFNRGPRAREPVLWGARPPCFGEAIMGWVAEHSRAVPGRVDGASSLGDMRAPDRQAHHIGPRSVTVAGRDIRLVSGSPT